MSAKATDAAWNTHDVSPTVKLVLLALADYADMHGKAIATTKALKKMTGLSLGSVRKAIEKMVKEGRMTDSHIHASHGPSTYVINIE